MTTLSLHSARIAVTSMAVFALALATPVFAADYSFVIRGVTDLKAPTKSVIYVTVTNATSKAVPETLHLNLGYSIGTAKIYKIINGVKKPTLSTQIKMGDEVVMKGNKIGGTFKVSEVTINERTFDLVGKVKDINTDVKRMRVLVGHSTYRNAGIKNKEITLTYTGATTCKRLGSSVACSTVDSKDQLIRAKGSVTGENQVYTLTNLWDNYNN